MSALGKASTSGMNVPWSKPRLASFWHSMPAAYNRHGVGGQAVGGGWVRRSSRMVRHPSITASQHHSSGSGSSKATAAAQQVAHLQKAAHFVSQLRVAWGRVIDFVRFWREAAVEEGAKRGVVSTGGAWAPLGGGGGGDARSKHCTISLPPPSLPPSLQPQSRGAARLSPLFPALHGTTIEPLTRDNRRSVQAGGRRSQWGQQFPSDR